MTRINPFVVLTGTALSYKVVGDTPTPALIDASNDGRPHDAYQHPDTGFWRLADPKYDPPGTTYTPVYVAHTPECPGARSFGMSHLVEWGTKLYGPRKLCRRDAIEDGLLPRFSASAPTPYNTDPHVVDDLLDEVYEDCETVEQAEGRAAELNAEVRA